MVVPQHFDGIICDVNRELLFMNPLDGVLRQRTPPGAERTVRKNSVLEWAIFDDFFESLFHWFTVGTGPVYLPA